MPTAIQALYADGSGGGLTREHEHELCAFALALDPSDDPTEVVVLARNEGGDEQKEVGASQPSQPSLTDEQSLSDDTDSSDGAPPVMDKTPSKKMPKKVVIANHSQEGEMKEVNSALNNHMSALLTLLRQTGAKGEKHIPESLFNPLREETMTALRNANFSFPHSRALLVAENDAIQLYTEEVRQKEEKKKKQESLEAKHHGNAENEGNCETTPAFVASASGNKAALPAAAASKRPRSDSGNDNGPFKKRAKKRRECRSEGCTNQAQQGGVCVKHGAKVKRCSSEGCTNKAVKGGVCVKHGAKVKRCSSEGCTNNAAKGGACIRHGAKVKLCSSEGCNNMALKGGVCWRHGAKHLKKKA
eukprot:scaffold4081_cov145-Skeletonema_menzelii.AAC.4